IRKQQMERYLGLKWHERAGEGEEREDSRNGWYERDYATSVGVIRVKVRRTGKRIALPLFSEVGRDLSRFPTAAHFASWLGLCPDNDISGGRVLWKGPRKIHNRAGQLFRLAAYGLHRSPTPLGAYLRRMKSKLGPRAATTATAHKIAIIFYTLVT